MFYCVFGVNVPYYNRNSPPCIIIGEKISLCCLLSAFQIICRLLITFPAFFQLNRRPAVIRISAKLYENLSRTIDLLFSWKASSTIINKTSPSIIERKTFACSLSVCKYINIGELHRNFSCYFSLLILVSC